MHSMYSILLHELTRIAPDPPIASQMTRNPHVITLIGLDPSALRVTLTATYPLENDQEPSRSNTHAMYFVGVCLEFEQPISPLCNLTALTYMYCMCSLLVDRRTP